MRTYCTLFDVNYLFKGLALHSSLMRHAQPFNLYILALDDDTRWLLDELDLPNVTIIPLSVLESRLNLAPVRESRNWMEYCWTLASQLMEFVSQIWMPPPTSVTYLDSDLFFYSSPEPIFDEINGASIGIIPHRFHAGNMRLAVNGLYNVSWLTIRTESEIGMACLTKWAAQCREWCYHRNEDGKFGDQAYLDSWPDDYGPNCAVIENIGAGCAPWNVMQYRAIQAQHRDGVFLNPTVPDGASHQLIFYHFHEFTHDSSGNVTRYTRHPHTLDHKRLIYGPYVMAIKDAAMQVLQARHRRQIKQDQLKDQGERA